MRFIHIVSLVSLMVTSPPVLAQSNPDAPASPPVHTGRTMHAEGVIGRVVDRNGRYLSDVFIEAISLDGVPVPELAILSDNDGRFHWPLRPGRYTLRAHLPSGERLELGTRVESGRNTQVTIRAN